MPVVRLCALGHPIPEGRALCPGCGFGELPVHGTPHLIAPITPTTSPAAEEAPRQPAVWPLPSEPGPLLQVETPVQVQTPVEAPVPVYVDTPVQVSPDGLWSWDGVSWSPTVGHPGHHAWATAVPDLPAPTDPAAAERSDDDEPRRWSTSLQLPGFLTDLPQRTLIALCVLVVVLVVAVGLTL